MRAISNRLNVLGMVAALWSGLASSATAQCPAWFPPTAIEPLNNGVSSFAVHNNRLVISGTFDSIGGTTANGLASFDGSTFTSMTSGRVAGVGQLAVSQGGLYITGGPSGSAGQMWTGSTWVSWPSTGIEPGTNILVRGIQSSPSLGILGEGTFVFPGFVLARYGFWENGAWRQASTQWGPNIESGSFTTIRDVEELDGFLYVAGDFGSIARGTGFNQNTVQSQGVCKFDGTQWLPMPRGGVNGTVRGLAIYQDQLILVGDFTATRDGAIALNRVARFDGTEYSPIGSGVSLTVTSVTVADDGTGEKMFFTASTGAMLRSDGGTPTFLPTLFGTPLLSIAFDPGFGNAVYVGGTGLRTNLQTQTGTGLIRWGPSTSSTIDTDGDGLLDTWETTGIDGDCNGTIDLNLAALGANPNHKDLFVEVDSMLGRSPATGALGLVQNAFANAPVPNPDGVTGINLRLIVDPADQSIPSQNFPLIWSDFHPLKSQYFGNPADRASPNRNAILSAKRRAFRYCMFANLYGTDTSSGIAELPGNDFIVTLGGFAPPGGTLNEQAATFMHEIGHTLGLYHGGHQIQWDNDRRYNYKPNYHSIMNYSWQLSDLRPGWTLDYSRAALPNLNEAALDEVAGLGGTLNTVTLVGPVPASEAFEVGGVDWNRNGSIDTSLVATDANHVDPGDPESDGDVLEGSEDWSRLIYNFRSSPNYASGSSPVSTIDQHEMDAELDAFIDSLYTGGCAADFNGDTTLDFFDYLDFVDVFAANSPTADFNADTVVDFFDYLDFVAAFAAGC